jgi:ribosomal protein S18 acetylase RimI-like enzyme
MVDRDYDEAHGGWSGSGIEVSPVRAAEVADVVNIHRAALPDTLNSRLGMEHLAYIYERTLKTAGAMVAVAREAGRPVGAVSAALDPEDLSRRLRVGLSLSRAAALALRVLRRPGLLRELTESIALTRPVRHDGSLIRPCLTAIVVADSARGRGVGRRLVGAVDSFMSSAGARAYHLDTRADNLVSRAFYARLGFQEVALVGRNIVLVRHLSPQSRPH